VEQGDPRKGKRARSNGIRMNDRRERRRRDRGMEEVLEQEQRGRERSESGRGRAAGSEDDDADGRRGRMRLVFGMRRVESGGREREGERWSGVGCHHPSRACGSYIHKEPQHRTREGRVKGRSGTREREPEEGKGATIALFAGAGLFQSSLALAAKTKTKPKPNFTCSSITFPARPGPARDSAPAPVRLPPLTSPLL
jgi:hypothetical protein